MDDGDEDLEGGEVEGVSRAAAVDEDLQVDDDRMAKVERKEDRCGGGQVVTGFISEQ